MSKNSMYLVVTLLAIAVAHAGSECSQYMDTASSKPYRGIKHRSQKKLRRLRRQAR